jgi:hypothetical protein
MRKKGHTKAKMKEIDPQKKFCSTNIKKVPRAYESLNPALVGNSQWCQPFSNLTNDSGIMGKTVLLDKSSITSRWGTPTNPSTTS